MSTHYYYLVLNLACISVPFLLSFKFRGQFYKKWYAVWPAILITALFFIIWDEPFTRWGVWGFNPKYILGIYIMNLPLEEILFFICIPYACLFTFDQLKIRLTDLRGRFGGLIHVAIAIILAILLIGHTHQKYTLTVAAASLLFMALTYLVDRYLHKSRSYLNHFYLAYAIVLIPFFLSNGFLTGFFTPEPIVWYDASHHLGITMGTIPVNDLIYYFLLFYMNAWIYERIYRPS